MKDKLLIIKKYLVSFPIKHVYFVFPIFAMLVILLLVPSFKGSSINPYVIPMDLSHINNAAPYAAPAAGTKASEPINKDKEITIQSGDTLSTLFASLGILNTTLHTLLDTSAQGKQLKLIQPGQKLLFGFNDGGELLTLDYYISNINKLTFKREQNGFQASKVVIKPAIKIVQASGTITDSLFLAAKRAELPNKITMKLAEIFGWDIDFTMDIRKDDSFNLIYEEKFLNGKLIGYGDIVAAEFKNKNSTYIAIRFTNNKGHTDYYNEKGESLRKSFLRNPVDFTRISSRYDPNRRHPIFKTNLPHRAVDYAASSGTPIKTSGDGVVSFSGKQRGYGNVVYIKHPNNITTVYAHMKKIHKRASTVGRKVSQGEVIGYVGMSGYATGPHLHYEFRVNGVHRNPLAVKLPDAKPLSDSDMNQFRIVTRVMLAGLELEKPSILVAQHDIEKTIE